MLLKLNICIFKNGTAKIKEKRKCRRYVWVYLEWLCRRVRYFFRFRKYLSKHGHTEASHSSMHNTKHELDCTEVENQANSLLERNNQQAAAMAASLLEDSSASQSQSQTEDESNESEALLLNDPDSRRELMLRAVERRLQQQQWRWRHGLLSSPFVFIVHSWKQQRLTMQIHRFGVKPRNFTEVSLTKHSCEWWTSSMPLFSFENLNLRSKVRWNRHLPCLRPGISVLGSDIKRRDTVFLRRGNSASEHYFF